MGYFVDSFICCESNASSSLSLREKQTLSALALRGRFIL